MKDLMKSKLSFRHWSDEFSSWVERIDQDFETMLRLAAQMHEWDQKTNIKFFVDPEEEDRDNDTTPECVGSKQFALEDDVSYKCNCCEADGTQWKRTRNLSIQKPSVRFPA